jgi:hypothetical protein
VVARASGAKPLALGLLFGTRLTERQVLALEA